MAFLKVLDEPRLHRTPTQQLLCLGARGREVLREQDPDETEVFDRLLRIYGSNWNVQMPSYHFDDMAHRHTLLGRRIHERYRRGYFHRHTIPTTTSHSAHALP